EAAEIQSVSAGSDIAQRHEILAVGGDEHGVMIHGVLLPAQSPIQIGTGSGAAHAGAVIDAGLDLGAFLIIVPGDELKSIKLIVGVEILAFFLHGGQPSLGALLIHNAVGAPGSQSIVEAFVS